MEVTKGASQSKEAWVAGEAYEPFMGRWSRLVAREFLKWLAVPPESRWLDVGCGTGALTQTILQLANPSAVKGIDAADGFISFVRGRFKDSRATFERGEAQALPIETSSYEAVVSGLVLNFVPSPRQAVKEMARAAKQGGLIATYLWDYAGKMQLLRHFWNACIALDPDAAALDEGRRFPLCNPGPLSDLFLSAGLRNVEVLPIDIWTEFKDFDDYWSPFLGGQGPAADRTRRRPASRWAS